MRPFIICTDIIFIHIINYRIIYFLINFITKAAIIKRNNVMTSHCVETANIFTIHISDRKNHFISIPFRHVHTDNSVNLKILKLAYSLHRILNNITFYIELCVILYMTNLATATPFIMLAHRLTTFIRRFCNLQRLTVCKIFLHFDNKHFNFIAVHRLRYKNRKSVYMRNSVTVRRNRIYTSNVLFIFFNRNHNLPLIVLYNSFIISFINVICKI